MKATGSIERAILQKLRTLPPAKQRELLEFAESLEADASQDQLPQSFIGMYVDQGVHITEEDIAEVRREMWVNFPREDV